MKTMLRMLVLSAGVFAVVLCMVSRDNEARADVPAVAAAVAVPVPDTEIAAAPAETPAAAPKPTDVILTSANTNSTAGTNSASLTNLAAFKLGTNVIMAPTIPETLQLSKPMSEVVKLVQAGVSEQVLMAFIAGAGDPFEAGSNEIIYLNDLGVSSNVITALLQHDSTPEMQARRQALGAVRPLPPGFALTTPATNIYTPKETSQSSPPAQNPPEPMPVNPPAGNAGSYVPGEATVSTTVPTAPAYATENGAGEAYDGAETTTTTINYNYWQSNLAPYGSWVDVGGYGACWRPTVSVYNSSWRPYADNGRWLWSNSGWYWYSDYSWGWGPFHYGRWTCPPGVGWVWVPGSTWGPAWVSWRSTPSYCGWAPLPPAARYRYGSGFYYGGVSVGIGCDFGLGYSSYVFLPLNRFCDRRPYNYYVSGGHGQTVYKDSTVVNNYAVAKNRAVINHGIGRDRVAQVTRGDIRQVSLKDTSSVRDLGLRREQLGTDGATLAVHRPDASTIARIGATAPARPSVTRPGAMRPGGAAPNQQSGAFRGSANPTTQARLTSPAISTPTTGGNANGSRSGSAFTTRPGATLSGPTPPVIPSRPQAGQGTTLGTGTTGSEVSGGATRPGRSPIIMRNPNPNRNNANRPVTYPYVPAQPSPAVQTPAPAASRPGASRSANGNVTYPGQSSPAAPRTSFVPGPPTPAPRAAYNNAPAARNYSAPAPTYSARPSYSAPAAPAPRVESSRPTVSAPSPSQSSGGSSGRSGGGGGGGRGQSSGRNSDGGSVQVGRGR